MPPGVGYGMGYNDIDYMADQGLVSRMMEHLPGITASLMFAQGRGANTILAGGGYMDFENATKGRMSRHRLVTDEGLSERRAGQFLGSRKRGARLLRLPGDKRPVMNFAMSSRVNHVTMRPRAARRFHSLSVFSNTNATGAYTPFQAFPSLGRIPKIQSIMQGIVGDAHTVGVNTLGPGLLSAISAGRRMDLMEARAVKKGSISPRLQRRLNKADRSIRAMAGMNATELLNATADPNGLMYAGKPITVGEVYGDRLTQRGNSVSVKASASGSKTIQYYHPDGSGRIVTSSGNQLGNRAAGVTSKAALDAPIARAPAGGVRVIRGAIGVPEVIGGGKMVGMRAVGVGTPVMTGPSIYDTARNRQIGASGAGITAAQIGIRGDMLVSVMPGATTQFLGGYTRTAMGFGAGLIGDDALAGRQKALNAIKQILPAGATDDMAEQFLMSKLRGGEGIRAGMQAQGVTARAIAQNTAARNVMLTRGAGVALRAANVLGTVSLAYDLGKMAGEVVVSGINLARDAYKSVQGSINKPAFGMGYQDTEAAATSRARGVMAIQNSRLNARSVLGSEAGMMAAHFG